MAPTAAPLEMFPVNGVDLAWSARGSSPAGTPTLVLCHGFTGAALDFSLVVDSLAIDRRVVTLDQRGHGHSTNTRRTTPGSYFAGRDPRRDPQTDAASR